MVITLDLDGYHHSYSAGGKRLQIPARRVTTGRVSDEKARPNHRVDHHTQWRSRLGCNPTGKLNYIRQDVEGLAKISQRPMSSLYISLLWLFFCSHASYVLQGVTDKW